MVWSREDGRPSRVVGRAVRRGRAGRGGRAMECRVESGGPVLRDGSVRGGPGRMTMCGPTWSGWWKGEAERCAAGVGWVE